MLTESVRDAADLWLSLRYPPVMFVCDTPCTFVQHINNRATDSAIHYWGDQDGCFEKPVLGKEPNSVSNVVDFLGTIEFQIIITFFILVLT